MPCAPGAAIRRWLGLAAQVARDLEARTRWHNFKVDVAEWAELGTVYEHPRHGRGAQQSARQRAARLRGERAERWR